MTHEKRTQLAQLTTNDHNDEDKKWSFSELKRVFTAPEQWPPHSVQFNRQPDGVCCVHSLPAPFCNTNPTPPQLLDWKNLLWSPHKGNPGERKKATGRFSAASCCSAI
ncbi:hypothetical protein Bbelb_441060 [Branchiostoma belcheri]|nr:hypothetical protein Bbelb_441060 [Branchiostoma belcheri]